MEHVLKAPINKGGKEVKYVINDITGCWEVVSHAVSSSGKGYPALRISGVYWQIHRLSFSLFKGSIPENLMVRHTCDNRICCNPEHLVLGSGADNMADAVSRSRIKSIFSPEQLAYIREDTGESDNDKAKKLGCSREHVRNIRLNSAMGKKRDTLLSDSERTAIKLDSRTKREIAKEYGISTMTVYRIRKA